MITPRAARMRAGVLLSLLVAWLVALSALAPQMAQADADRVVYARVVVGTAALRTGPGATFRIVRVANQGDTFPVHERGTRGYWLRVELPDGSLAWVQGDAVYVHEVGPGSAWQRFLAKLFAPPPLLGARGEISLTAGVLSKSGFLALRPSWLIAPAFALEANLAASVGSAGRIFIGGLGGVVNIFPSWRIVPFFTVGGGIAQVAPNADTFVLKSGTRSATYAGGGLRFGFRQRIILRVEGRGYVFFDANNMIAQQEVSGGFSAFF